MNMDNILISIIVPIYNVEKYIEKCIESILTQNIKEKMEVIFVDDGSTDSSAAITQVYCENNNTFRLVCQSNSGLGAARNRGVEYAKGKYILYLDSDDYLRENSVLELISTAEENNLDVLQGSYKVISEQGIRYGENSHDLSRVLSGREWIMQGNVIYGACFCLYRREFLIENNLRFMEGVYHEDMDYTIHATWRAKRILSRDILFYYYVDRPGSITQTNSIKRCTDYYKVACNVKKWVDEEVDSEAYDAFFREYLAFLHSHIVNMAISQNFQIKDIFDNEEIRISVLQHLRESNRRKYHIEYFLLKYGLYDLYTWMFRLVGKK